jgi:hypothetical protein
MQLLLITLLIFLAYIFGLKIQRVMMRRHLVRNIESHRYSPELHKGMKKLLEAYDEY